MESERNLLINLVAYRSLYRRALKLSLDWTVHRHLWRGQALYIRSLFEANKMVTDPRKRRALLAETEKLLDEWKHPEPYIPPTAPGGSKYERNLPPPYLDRKFLALVPATGRIRQLTLV
jgi:NADH dehydrogenase (ubiquinone) 1 beta subcomplex subunit 9